MNSELIIICANSCLYFALFLVTIFANRKSRTSILLTSLWAVSSATSIWYYLHVYHYSVQVKPLTIVPFIYLFVFSVISFIPIFKTKDVKISHIDGNQQIVQFISILIGLVALLPFCEAFIYLMRTMGVGLSQIANNYGENFTYLSAPSQTFSRYLSYLRIVSPILFFYNLSLKKGHRAISIGLLLAIVTPILNNLNVGSRFVLVTDGLYLIYIYMLFYNQIENGTRAIITRVFLGFGSTFLILFLAITYYRFNSGNSDISILDWMSLYSGESFLNFNSDLWTIHSSTGGDNAFFIFKHFLGLYADVNRNPDYLESLVPIRMNVFYTFIGDFLVDIGTYWTSIFIALISFIFSFFINFQKRMSLHKIILLGMYAKIVLNGFTYYTYLNAPLTPFYTTGIALILWIYFDTAKAP